ncbi:hypothetical protein [Cryobacterium psychrophilum]|uniref:Uncharacterized protein n=1 Tax=Cryobacterium psychrophilum TaxID=41988 RepID=A0A4Y8KM01_9MICO|nr:hypothetical protein [Cryobacterium psychrophilum]TFD76309.1 hypothetical protein E3T53_13960 [Cryobacterium psychrophilum]
MGIKTRATFEPNEEWRRGDPTAAPWILFTVTIAFSAALVHGALMLAFGDTLSNTAIATISFVGFGGILGTLISAGFAATRTARE